jgi:peptide/nickel transport system substrate-binding protein
MNKKALLGLVVLLMALMLVTPVFAWTYWDGSEDTKFETFGPRVDKLLISLYSSDISEWEAGLEAGKIDITDWPLDTTHYERYKTDPRFHVLGYGAEFGLFIFDLNNNNNTYLGNPPDPSEPNPVWPNPMGYDLNESDNLYDDGWALRWAICHLADRETLVQHIGEAVTAPMYTVIPPAMGKYMHPEITPGGSLYDLVKYDPTEASRALNESGLFPYDPASGWRYWDRNRNGQKDPGEGFQLKIFVRQDHAGRLKAGEMLIEEFERTDPLIKIPYSATFGDISAARLQVMTDKDFHIYTGGWSLGVDPDHVILWNWDFYWHPGRPYNYAGVNKDGLNEASYGVMYANTQADAVYWCRVFQEQFAETAASVPLYSAAGYKAMSKTYVGAEDEYNGEEWTNMVNWPGYGIDNGYTFLNMHVNTSEWMPNGVIRYGFKTTDIRQFNPIYSEWLWDNIVLDLIGYESLLARNPYTLEFIPWVAKTFEVGTYEHPDLGECTKIRFVIRNDVYFQDGVKLDVNDIKFTFDEIDDILESRGLAPPWWISNVQNILTFDIMDPQTFEVLLDVKSVYAVGWIGGNRILPEHIWRPICVSGDPSAFAPDPNMIGSGPWRLDEYIAESHILLVANKPGSVVDTGFPGSTPVESTMGFFRLTPAYVDVHPEGYAVRVEPDTNFNLISTVKNLMEEHNGCTNPNTTLTGTKYVWIDNTPLVNGKTVTLTPGGVDTDTNTINLPMGLHTAKIAFQITGPIEMVEWVNTTWVNTTWPIYATISEDLNLDFTVDIFDIVQVGLAFGARPGDPNWNAAADLVDDDIIDIFDLVKVAIAFGWPH